MAVLFSSVLTDVAVSAITLFVLTYFYFAHAFSYWRKRGVHFIQPTSVFGNLRGVALREEGIGEYLRDAYHATAGHAVVGLFAGRRPILMVRDPDVLRDILVADSTFFVDRPFEISCEAEPLVARSLFFLKGERWKSMRKKLNTSFTPGKIKNMFPLINDCAKGLLPCIERDITKGNCLLVKNTVARYTTDVIASCAFGVNANALADPNSEFRAVTRKVFERGSSHNFANMLSIFLPRLRNLLRLKYLDGNVNEYFRKIFWSVVDYRKKNGVIRHDFLDILIRVKYEGGTAAENENDAEKFKQGAIYTDEENTVNNDTQIKLEDDDFVAQAFIFISAGFETSSSVITFALLELALKPEIQDKLRCDMLLVLDKHNSRITYDSISEMSYLEMVISEVLRRNPTLPLLERKCTSDYKIRGTQVIIEKGTVVYVPLMGIHSDPNIYPEPDEFNPERFAPENQCKRHHFTFIPFGEGPRNCIGMRFGRLQVKIALVHILTTYQVRPCPQTPKLPLKLKPSGGVSTPAKDIILAFYKIK